MIIDKKKKTKNALIAIVFVICCIALNLIPAIIIQRAGIPLYLGSFGTIMATLLGGTFPGVIVGFFTTAVNGAFNIYTLYFGIVNVLISFSVAWLNRKGMFKSVIKTILGILIIVLIEGTVSSLVSWYVYGFGAGIAGRYAEELFAAGGFTEFNAQLAANFIIDLCDKMILVLFAVLTYTLLPKKMKSFFYGMFHLRVYDDYEYRSTKKSFLKKAVLIVLCAELVLGTIACAISFFLYNHASVDKYTEFCNGIVNDVRAQIDPELVDGFMATKGATEEYKATERELYRIKNSFSQVERIYAYRITEEGFFFVFDLDADTTKSSGVGEVVPFDESVEKYLPPLLAKREVGPIFTNETRGYMLTVYKPLFNYEGEYVCHVATDISVDQIFKDQTAFLAKMLSLFFGVSIIIVSAVLEYLKVSTIIPLNSMASATRQFAFDSVTGREKSLERLKKVDVHSEDELENLHLAVIKMAEDSGKYIEQVKTQSEQISRIQGNIIIDFADLVESRDKSTGDHVKNTSKYVRDIATELRDEGKYLDVLTDEYISKIVRSAPLHDIGKITISDVILNKPGKLTPEEFEIMKTHTTAGREILINSSTMEESGDFLDEAINMATYHHERWDGAGYPEGLKGDEIPLSARIMAVADVFDALVSKRCYKEPFTFEKAIEIVKEESGTHFDPDIAEAFVKVAERNHKKTDV